MADNLDFTHFSLNDLLREEGFQCSCGMLHKADIREVVIGQGVLDHIVAILKKYGGTRPYIISDENTYLAAGKAVCGFLDSRNISYKSFIFSHQHPIPDEYYVGQAVLNFDPGCDFIISVGSGTINDIGKIISKVTGLRYAIVCTAPSMDGYASSTSSMVVDGIKVSLDSALPIAIIADTDVLCNAPIRLIQAGLGDIIAKYISICEWRISNLINNEYYCERVAELVRRSVKKCVQSVRGSHVRDPETITGIMEGLVMSGIAMSFAGCTRPASGIEHYFSHTWDMRNLDSNKQGELHGIQVGVGTLLAFRIYDFIRQVTPDREKALEYTANFDLQSWNDFLRSFLGKSGDSVIRLEEKEGKYDKVKHKARIDIIIENWQSILAIISEELPEYQEVEEIMKSIGAPVAPEDINISRTDARHTFTVTKDIRDKYIASRLLWDLGLLDEAAAIL